MNDISDAVVPIDSEAADAAARDGAARGLRILHCPWNVGCNPATLARFERQRGLLSHSVTLFQDPFGFQADEVLFEPDIDVIEQAARRKRLLARAISDFDVIHFNFGQSIIEETPQPEQRLRKEANETYWRALHYHLLWRGELALLRGLNKVVVMTYQGDDARQGDYCRKHFEISAANAVDYYTPESDALKRWRIRHTARFADRIYSLNPDLLHVLPKRARFMPYASVDAEEWRLAPARDDGLPIVVHAPTNRGAKGTSFILAAIEKLREEGVAFEFILVENMTRDEAKRLYERAHLVIDQVLVGWYGAFAAEVMAMGKPVVCYIRKQDLKFIPPEMARDLPLIEANPSTIADVLRDCLTWRRGELTSIGLAGRRFVEKWHNPRTIAATVAGDYASLVARKRNPLRRLTATAVGAATRNLVRQL